jgi:hypothetical protein
MTDTWLFRAEVSLIVGAVVVLLLWWLMLLLDRRGHTASYRLPICVGFILRLLAVAFAAAVPSIGRKITSNDEAAFVVTTQALAALPLHSSQWLSMLTHWTEVVPWALTYKVFGTSGLVPLRLEQVGLSLAAVIIASSTAGKIGGRRAGLTTAWIAAVEPSCVYFSGLLHQESLSMLGEAILLAALVDLWMRDTPAWQPLGAGLLGLAVIFGTRAYMAFFAGVAVVLVVVGAELTRRMGLARALTVLTVSAVLVALIGIALAPHVLAASLAHLQAQLDYHYPGANLALPHVNVTSSAGLLKTIVSRSVDLIFKPFPWQVGSAAQKAAVVGTLIWYVLLAVAAVLTFRQGLDERLVPVLILFVCETIGFALTLVDTGEGFRHRVNLVLLLSVPLGVMLSRRRSGHAANNRFVLR